MLPSGSDIADIRRQFRWQIPERFNIAVACCDRHEPSRPALLIEDVGGRVDVVSFGRLRELAARFANSAAAHGVAHGDRVAILLGQRLETVVSHLAAYRSGAIALPLFGLFGPEALQFRLRDSGATGIVTDAAGMAKLLPLLPELPALRHIWSVEPAPEPARSFWSDLEAASDQHRAVPIAADDPALLIYTSGTTGAPKGALHAHRVLLGHLPGVQLPQELFPQTGDLFWTPADWAWIGGLLDVLLPSLYFGVPVAVGPVGRFDPESAADFMARREVRNVFLPPTALRLMKQADVRPAERGAKLRSIGSGGERLGDETLAWAERAFGCAVNEFYGQTEANLLVSSCRALFPRRSGAAGLAVPGHEVGIIDGEGRNVATGEIGDIAVRRPDPVMFLGYWNNPAATEAKFRGDWLVTGDLGRMDEDGYVTYLGRDDDLINSAGYRIGPAEVEDCLLRHPAVALCAVIGVPDPLRGEVVKAFVVPTAGRVADDGLASDIQTFVRDRLAAHEYPRQIEFVLSLPTTATGKVRRAELRQRDGGRSGTDAASSGDAAG